MEHIFFAFLALFGWGTGDVAGGVVARKIGGHNSAIWMSIFSILLASIYAPFAISELHRLTLGTALILIALIIIAPIPIASLYRGIQAGNPSLVVTIGAAFFSITVILSVIFLGEKISSNQIISIAIVVLGTFLLSVNFKMFRNKNALFAKDFYYGLTSMILWGIYFAFIKIPVKEIGWFWPSYLSLFSFPLIYVFMRVKKIEFKSPKNVRLVLLSILNAFLLTAGTFAYNFAISKGDLSVVAPIAGSYPLLFILLAHFIFKDKITKQQIFGIFVVLTGIISLSIFSSI